VAKHSVYLTPATLALVLLFVWPVTSSSSISETIVGLTAGGCRLRLGPGISDPDVACFSGRTKYTNLSGIQRRLVPLKVPTLSNSAGGKQALIDSREFRHSTKGSAISFYLVPLCLRQINPATIQTTRSHLHSTLQGGFSSKSPLRTRSSSLIACFRFQGSR